MIFTTLSGQQQYFTKNVGDFILWINSKGYTCALREVQRTQVQADYNAAHGLGIKHSLHLDCLAMDLLIFKNGKLLENKDELQFCGTYWETLNLHNRWGGNFKSMFDGAHFEMQNAVQ